MKTKYVVAVAAVALFALVQPSNAWFGAVEHPEHPRDGAIGPGEMKFHGGVGTNYPHYQHSVIEEVFIRYDFVFRLADGSDGIYPAGEVVEVEIPGNLNPDGSESSSFVISIPIGSFRDASNGFFYTFNPAGLKISQRHESYEWDFVGEDGVHQFWGDPNPGGVTLFWAYIRQRDEGEMVNLGIRMRVIDDRPDDGTAEPSPNFLDLLVGGPSLTIGNDGWETQMYNARNFWAGPYSPPD